MICPRCARTMSQVHVAGVTIDACQHGCGGLWFDQAELRRFDESCEDVGSLLTVDVDPHLSVDLNARLECPCCPSQKMMRHFFTTKHEVEVDECPSCAGFWLDAGELARIRSLFETEGDANAAAREHFRAEFSTQLQALAAESRAQADRANRFRSFFRFICPSNYIPRADAA